MTPGNYPKENILHTGHGESLKSRIITLLAMVVHEEEVRKLMRGADGCLY